MPVTIKQQNEEGDGLYNFEEWDEVPDILYFSPVCGSDNPVLNRQEWEEFKKCGDMVFDLMAKGE